MGKAMQTYYFLTREAAGQAGHSICLTQSPAYGDPISQPHFILMFE